MLPGAVTAIVNREAALPVPGPHAMGSEARAVLDGMGREVIDWGTSLGFARAVSHADRLVPGVALPYVAWQLFSSLSEASRGNITRAMQRLPFTALAPAMLLDHLGRCLGSLLPADMRHPLHYQDVVIGVALCALLHALTRQRVPATPQTTGGRVLLQLLSHLRSGLNLLDGIQGIVNRDVSRRQRVARALPAPRGCHASPAHGNAPSIPPPRNATLPTTAMQVLSQAFPVTAGRLHAAAASEAAEPMAPLSSAWPLSSAEAQKARPPKPPRLRPKPPAGSFRPSKQRRKFQVRRDPARGDRPAVRRDSMDAAGPQRPSTLDVPTIRVGAPARIAAEHKESMMSPSGNPGKDRKPKLPPRTNNGRNAGGRPRDADASGGGLDGDAASGNGTGAAELPLERIPQQEGDATDWPEHGPGAGSTVAPGSDGDVQGIPSCLRFHHTSEAWRQVLKSRFEPAHLRFCVHEKAVPLFRQVLRLNSLDEDQRRWIVTTAVREHLPPAPGQQIRKYSGLGQILRHQARGPTALGSDEVYAVSTISVLPERKLRAHHVEGMRILPQNSFKLIRHAPPGSAPRMLIAYFINRPTGAETGVKAGLLEVAMGDHNFTLVDPDLGTQFSSDTLDDLVAGIEKISGCRYRPDADAIPWVNRPLRGHLPVIDGLHLFVREEALSGSIAPYERLPYNTDLNFFAPVPFQFLDGLVSGMLFRNSFTIIGGSVVFVDDLGQLGTLQFSSGGPEDRCYTLERHGGFERQFIREHGLQEGETYGMEEVAEILENYDLIGLSPEDIPPPAPKPRLDGFHVALRAVAINESVAVDTAGNGHLLPPPEMDSRALPRSTFRFDDNEVLYVDHDGKQGVLKFISNGSHGRHFMLAGDNGDHALRFARTNGIDAGSVLVQDEIIWALVGNGFVQIPK